MEITTNTTQTDFNQNRTGRIGIMIGILAVVSIVTLSLLYSGFPFFGPVNDMTNAVVGVLYFSLAFHIDKLLRPQSARQATFLLFMAFITMLFTTINSVLVAFGQMHWMVGGMYTAIGLGFLGIWLLSVLRSGVLSRYLSPGLSRLAMVAGILMLVGFVAGPLFIAGGDITQNPLVNVAFIGTGGAWVLFPIWSYLVGRKMLLTA